MPIEMNFISTKEYAANHGIAERTVRNLLQTGKLQGAQLVGKTWNVPADALCRKGRMHGRKYRLS